MSANKVPVTVIIVHYKTLELTVKALRALFASAVLPMQVILVDNNSEDGIETVLGSEFPGVEYVGNTDNVGFAKANNEAIRSRATEPYIWLLNSDTETSPATLGELVAYMGVHAEVGALSPQLVYPDRSWQSVGGYFPTPSNVFRYLFPISAVLPASWRKGLRDLALYPQEIVGSGFDLDYVTGAAMFLRRSALDEAGLLGEDYFMYFEETDLCWRLREKGWAVRAIPSRPVMHVYGGSFRRRHDPARLRLFLESLKTFTRLHLHGWRRALILLLVTLGGPVSIRLKNMWYR